MSDEAKFPSEELIAVISTEFSLSEGKQEALREFLEGLPALKSMAERGRKNTLTPSKRKKSLNPYSNKIKALIELLNADKGDNDDLKDLLHHVRWQTGLARQEPEDPVEQQLASGDLAKRTDFILECLRDLGSAIDAAIDNAEFNLRPREERHEADKALHYVISVLLAAYKEVTDNEPGLSRDFSNNTPGGPLLRFTMPILKELGWSLNNEALYDQISKVRENPALHTRDNQNQKESDSGI